MSSPNFGSVLDKPSNEIERPRPAPQGSYLCTINGMPRFDKSAKKQTEFVEFSLRPIQAMEDVDEDALKEWGGLADKTFKHTFYLTENSVYRLKEFLIQDLEIDEQDTLRPMIDETPGKQCLVTIKHTASDDGKSVYANVASTAKAE